MDAFVISSLPSPMLETLQMAGPLRSADIIPVHRSYGPRRPPLVFGRLPGFAGYTAYLAPTISRRDEEGFSSYPRFWIQRPSSERRGDFNPHDSCAAQRTLSVSMTSIRSSGL